MQAYRINGSLVKVERCAAEMYIVRNIPGVFDNQVAIGAIVHKELAQKFLDSYAVKSSDKTLDILDFDFEKNFLKEYGIAVVAYTGTEKDVKQVIKARDEEKRMAVQKLEEYALNREALKGLRSKLKRLADAGKPAAASVASYDAAAISTTPYHPGMMNIAEECQRILLKIADRQAEILIIEDALQIINKGINCEHYSDILIMRHVDGYSMERITEKLGYSSRQAIYNQYNKALAKFAKALGL